MARGGRFIGTAPTEALDILSEDLPTISPSRLDTSGIRRRTQEFAAGGIRKLRGALRAGLAKTSDNPNVAAMMKGRLLESFGTGLEGVIGEARRGATSVGLAEMQELSAIERLKFDAELKRRFAQARLSVTEPSALSGGSRVTTPSARRAGGYFSNEAIRARNFGLKSAPGFEQRFDARKVGTPSTASGGGSILSRLNLRQ